MCDHNALTLSLSELYQDWAEVRNVEVDPLFAELLERMSYRQLYALSEPKRKDRSRHVSGPPLKLDAYQDSTYYYFNFKSQPSTTGLRHKGFIKFMKPRLSSTREAENVDCMVDCTCPDFRYRWAWTNKQRGSSKVGPGSLNQAHNRAPRITNPTGRPGLCKHLLALADYIFGSMVSFKGVAPEASEFNRNLDRLVRYATDRWINYQDHVGQARTRDRRAADARAARRRGEDPDFLHTDIPDETNLEVSDLPPADVDAMLEEPPPENEEPEDQDNT